MQNRSNTNDSIHESEGFNSRIQGAVDKLDEGIKVGKQKLATAMDSGSDHLLSGLEAVEAKALSSAVKLSDGAKYLREATGKQMFSDCCSLVVKYPLFAMSMAGIAGLLLGKSLYNRSAKQY